MSRVGRQQLVEAAVRDVLHRAGLSPSLLGRLHRAADHDPANSNLSWELGQATLRPKLLIHDRDSKFVAGLDEVFRSEGVRVATTPYRAPRANAVCERWIGSVRREALDWLLTTGERQLCQVLSDYVEHYNVARLYRSLRLRAPLGGEDSGQPIGDVVCRSRLGGLLHEYSREAV